jgi:hypothetical protein
MTDLTRVPAFTTTMERLKALKRVAASGMEYWMAREIYQTLGYPTWRGFEGVIQRAQDACNGAGYEATRHFVRTSKMLRIGNDAERRVEDWFDRQGARPCCPSEHAGPRRRGHRVRLRMAAQGRKADSDKATPGRAYDLTPSTRRVPALGRLTLRQLQRLGSSPDQEPVRTIVGLILRPNPIGWRLPRRPLALPAVEQHATH